MHCLAVIRRHEAQRRIELEKFATFARPVQIAHRKPDAAFNG